MIIKSRENCVTLISLFPFSLSIRLRNSGAEGFRILPAEDAQKFLGNCFDIQIIL